MEILSFDRNRLMH